MSQSVFTRFRQSDDNSRVPTCLRVQYTFSASVPVLTTTSVQVSQDNCNHPSSKIIPDLPVILHNCPNSGQRKTWKQTHNKVSCFISSSAQNNFHFLHSSGRFYWLTVLHAQLKQFHNCSSNHGCYLMHLRNSRSTFPNRWCPHVSFFLTPSSTNSLNTKFHCAFSAMTVPISLSQHSSTYTARQTTMLQASISRLPVSANIHQVPLILHTTEPQVFNYSPLISQMWQLNQGHWQSKLDPPGSHANVSQMWQLNQGHWPSRLSCQLPSQMWQLNQGHRPSRLSCQLPSQNVATKPRSPTLQVLMPTFLFLTIISRHDARLSSTTHCALRASRINYNLTNLSRCNSFS